MKTFFVITDKSELERWDISRSKMNINQAVIDGMTSQMIRTNPGIFTLGDLAKQEIAEWAHMPCGIAVGPNNYSVVRMPIRKIPLKAPFAISGSEAWPDFDGPHPVMAVDWLTPGNMMIWLCAHIGSGLEAMETHLVAMDEDKRSWRLPLSNLYADCKLCSGRYDNYGESILDTCRKVLTQFNNSTWNSDLYTDATGLRRNMTKELFAYNVENDGFVQRKAPTKWWTLCEKVSTQFLTTYVLY